VVTLQCGGMVGQPSIQTIIEVRECSERSWQHYLDQLSTTERFQFVKTVLDRLEGGHCSNSSSTSSSFTSKADLTTTTTDVTTTTSSTRKKSSTTTTTTSSCPPYNCSSCISSTATPPSPFSESELLFVGPGYYAVGSELLSIPSLAPTNCSVSTNIIPWNIYSYVATIVSHGVLLCGGEIRPNNGHAYKSNKCFLLTNEGFWLSSPPIASMSTSRTEAAAVNFAGGWWVIGGQNESSSALASTEVYYEKNNTWVASIDYPEPVYGHCAVKLNTTHVFFASGYSYTTYIYSRERGFVKQENMKTRRRNHACALYEDKVFVVGGYGGGKYVEFFSLTLLSWENSLSVAPSLPLSSSSGELLVLGGSLTYFSDQKKIFKMVKIVWNTFTRYEWQELGELSKSTSSFKILRWRINCTAWN